MSVPRKLLATFIASVWSALLGLLLLPVYLRYVGVEAYGLLGFFVTLQAWVSLLDMGLAPTINREIARFSAGVHSPQHIRDLLRSVEVLYAGVALLLVLTVASASGWLASDWLNLRALSPETATKAIAVMALVMGIQWQGTLYRSAVLGLQDQVWLSAAMMATATLRALLTLAVLEWVAPTIVAFVAAQCASAACETILFARRVHRRLPATPRPARFSLDALREVWRFAAGLTLITILATLLTQVDKLLLSRLLPLDEFGYFALAIALAGAMATLITPVDSVAYPRLSELVAAGRPDALAAEYHRFAQLLAIMVVPAALVLSVFSHEVMLAWTQDPTTAHKVAPILSVWVLGTAANGLMHVPYAAQLAHGWARLTVIINTIAVLVMVPAILMWVPGHGAIAAAWIWLLLNLAYIVFSVGLMHRKILTQERWAWYGHDVAAPVALSVLATGAMAAVHNQLQPLDRFSELGFLGIALGVTTVAAALGTPAGRNWVGATIRHLAVRTL